MASNTGRLIDELGDVRKKIADLVGKEERLKAQIREFGEGVHNGTVYCATVSYIERNTLDPKKVARRLDPRALRACYKKSTVTEVRVTARSAATARRTVARQLDLAT
jgi:hypothetical protein